MDLKKKGPARGASVLIRVRVSVRVVRGPHETDTAYSALHAVSFHGSCRNAAANFERVVFESVVLARYGKVRLCRRF